MRNAKSDLRTRLTPTAVRVTGKNYKKICREWRRQTELCDAIQHFFRKMRHEAAQWDYKRKPFHMKRSTRAYQLALVLCSYKSGSKTKQLPIALYEIGYDKHGGAREACKKDLVKRIRNKAIIELRSKHRNATGLGPVEEVMKSPCWLHENHFDLWVAKYKLLATSKRDANLNFDEPRNRPETSAAGAARARNRGAESSVSSSTASTSTTSSSLATASASSTSATSANVTDAATSSWSSTMDGESTEMQTGDFGENMADQYSYSSIYSDVD